jgi:hypothetical protein
MAKEGIGIGESVDVSRPLSECKTCTMPVNQGPVAPVDASAYGGCGHALKDSGVDDL